MDNFIHLHLHSEYSLLDGAAAIKKAVQRAVEMNMTSLAITDHGSMYGVIEFYNEAKSKGIKPIIGCEVYTAPGSRFEKYATGSKPYGHLVLLCKNQRGYQNLMELVTKSNTEGFYYKPRVDMELLSKHSEGLIALSACLRGDVPMAYLNSGYESAKNKAREYISVFGKDNFYLEIQHHGIPQEDEVTKGFIKLSEELGVGLVATNDVHYVNKEDALIQDVLSCIQTGKRLSDTDRMKMNEEEYYLKSPEQMSEMFSHVPEAIANTLKIAEKCNLEIDMSSVHLPKIIIESSLSHEEYLKSLCMQGLKIKYDSVDETLIKRLDYELDVINSMGYTDYFLVVHDFIKYAKDSKIPIGPGRGSAAGSLCAYVLNITEIDPISNGLIFERFLNPERISMPDIDIDICYERRDEVRDYVSRKYGADRVAQIVTFGTMAARAAIKDVARVLGVDISIANKVSKAVPSVLGITLQQALESSSELKDMYYSDMGIQNLIDIAMSLEGYPRHTSIHAAGVVIGDDILSKYVPLQESDGILVTQYPMGALEQIGLLKMDFLGLRNLTIIKDTSELVRAGEDVDFDIEKIPPDDKKTFELIQKGDTDGLFQLENPGLQTFLRKFRPKSIDDIIITTSIYRPGPMDQIPEFLKNVRNPNSITYKHPSLEPILKPTYGVVVYQEQVMDIVRTLAGYSMGRADLVRRAMAKKKQSVMQMERDIFVNGLVVDGRIEIEGAVRRGISAEDANGIFDSLTDFANYAFNKSHAACYALVAYRTAYLKAHYPTHYLASVLKNYAGYMSKAAKYLNSFKKYGIGLLPPDVNKSMEHFMPENGNVRFGLSWIKNVGTTFPKNIVAERNQSGYFKDFEDFIRRMCFYDINKRCVEAMIKCGAFDSLYPNRQVLIFNYERLIDEKLQSARAMGRGQLSWLSVNEADTGFSQNSLRSADYDDYSPTQKLAFEMELAGMYLSGHPMDRYAFKAQMTGEISVSDAVSNPDNDGRRFTVCGAISDLSVRKSKSGKTVASFVLSDYSGFSKVTVFESVFFRHSEILKNGGVIAATVTVNSRGDDEACEMILMGAADLDTLNLSTNKNLYVKLSDNTDFNKIRSLCANYKGNTKICVYFENTKTLIRSDENHGIILCEELFNKLCDILGSENVKIK